MHRMKEFMEKLEECAKCEFDKGLKQVNTEEMGEVIDMIKDCAMTLYYYTCYEAMKREEMEWDEERKYYPRLRDSRGRFMKSRRGYEEPPYMHMMDMDGMSGMDYDMGRMYYPDSMEMKHSRYGKSYDDYMEGRKHYSISDASQKQERMKMLDEYTKDLTQSINKILEDVSQEEKSMLRSKLTKLVTAMQ